MISLVLYASFRSVNERIFVHDIAPRINWEIDRSFYLYIDLFSFYNILYKTYA